MLSTSMAGGLFESNSFCPSMTSKDQRYPSTWTSSESAWPMAKQFGLLSDVTHHVFDARVVFETVHR